MDPSRYAADKTQDAANSLETPTLRTDPVPMPSDITREEFAARIEAVEARSDARVAGLEGKFSGLEGKFSALEGKFEGLRADFATFRTELLALVSGLQTKAEARESQRWIIATMLGTGLAIAGLFLGVAALFWSSQANMIAAFQAGMSLPRPAQEAAPPASPVPAPSPAP